MLANLHRDEEEKPEPFRIDDFMPGSQLRERDDLVAFAEAIAAGETFEVSAADNAKFRKTFQKNFNEVNA